jgi:hypothetical protein
MLFTALYKLECRYEILGFQSGHSLHRNPLAYDTMYSMAHEMIQYFIQY